MMEWTGINIFINQLNVGFFSVVPDIRHVLLRECIQEVRGVGTDTVSASPVGCLGCGCVYIYRIRFAVSAVVMLLSI